MCQLTPNFKKDRVAHLWLRVDLTHVVTAVPELGVLDLMKGLDKTREPKAK
jgi:hypothetical protein